MATSINLLPKDLEVSKKAQKWVTLLNRATAAIGGFLIIGVIAAVLGMFLLQRQVASRVAARDSLASNITSLQATEQKLILIKDRLTRVQAVLADRGKYNILRKMEDIRANLSGSAVVSGIELDINNQKIRFTITDTQSLVSLIDKKRKTSGFALDNLGYYHPRTKEKSLNLDGITAWELKGAQVSDAVKKLIDTK